MANQNSFQKIIRLALFTLIVSAVSICLYYFILFASWDYDINFLQADACLEAGGVYESNLRRCWYAGQCEDEGGVWSAAVSSCIK